MPKCWCEWRGLRWVFVAINRCTHHGEIVIQTGCQASKQASKQTSKQTNRQMIMLLMMTATNNLENPIKLVFIVEIHSYSFRIIFILFSNASYNTSVSLSLSLTIFFISAARCAHVERKPGAKAYGHRPYTLHKSILFTSFVSTTTLLSNSTTQQNLAKENYEVITAPSLALTDTHTNGQII